MRKQKASVTSGKAQGGASPLLHSITLIYVILLIAANVMASKVIALGPVLIDAGTLTYPLTFMLGDLLAECFDQAAARRVVYLGFAANLAFSALCFIGALLPGARAAADFAAAYDLLFRYNPRILVASFTGYLTGSLLNLASFRWIRILTGERFLALRTIGSTLLGAAVDTLLFTLIAWAFTIPWHDLAVMALSSYCVKMAYETLIATPLDYLLAPLLLRKLATYK
jgi:uncharacterized integral membrane protein (TIGR00697 family)